MTNPSPKEIQAHRNKVGLTQTQAAQLVSVSLRAWQQWEGGHRKMPVAAWELFQIKTTGEEK